MSTHTTTSEPAASHSAGPRELLVLLMRCAAQQSASFVDALRTVERATDGADSRALARELLGDLAIRNWIELRRVALGSEAPVARLHYELELTDPRNWDERIARPPVRYALTEKGQERAEAMALLTTRPEPPRRST